MSELDIARKNINDIDKKMAALFEERMREVKKVAEYKREYGLQVFDSGREAQILEKNSELIKDESLKQYYINFLQSNMDISKNYQHRLLEGMTVAFSGVEGAFANIAANKVFPDALAKAFPDFKSAYNSVVSGECDCVILPIENSYNGDVGQVMDLAFFGPLFINGVYDISVVQNLLAVKGTTVDEVKTVISHPQALGQCASYIKKHGFETLETVNTAVAVKQVADWGGHDVAAIGSEEAGIKFGLKKLEAHINESNNNTTRFAVFSRTANVNLNTDNHFIMLFTVTNEAGSLGKAISIIGDNGFNLKALKSRPTKELIWNYYFFVEGEGNINSEQGKKMIDELKAKWSVLKVLGSFEKEILL